MKQTDIIKAFAGLYFTSIGTYHSFFNLNNNTTTHKRFASEFRASLKWPLKHCGTLIPPKASEEALKIANEKNIDLFALQWKDQPKAEEIISGKLGRNIFVHEHEIPVSILYQELLAAKSEDEIIKILSKQSLVWITKKENDKLPQYKREKNSYESVGIKYIENPYGDKWMEKPFIKPLS
jgi:hypothetical protein